MPFSANAQTSLRTAWQTPFKAYSRLSDQRPLRKPSLEDSEETALIAVYDQRDADAESIKAGQLQEPHINEASSFEHDASDVIKATPKHNWRSYIWDSLDKSPEERKFLFKLDAAVLTFASLGYFIKNLDQVNINNAFVSGMKEDLNLYKNELNYMQTCWTVGYVLGELPCKPFEPFSAHLIILLLTAYQRI
jgi:hypothetical protein